APPTHAAALHDALPIYDCGRTSVMLGSTSPGQRLLDVALELATGPRGVPLLLLQDPPIAPDQHAERGAGARVVARQHRGFDIERSEEHTSELQSRENLV